MIESIKVTTNEIFSMEMATNHTDPLQEALELPKTVGYRRASL